MRLRRTKNEKEHCVNIEALILALCVDVLPTVSLVSEKREETDWGAISTVPSTSSDKLDHDIDYLNYLCSVTNVRVVHVATKNTSFGDIDKYLEFQYKTGCQVTVKELIGFDDSGMYHKIKDAYPDLFCLDAGDYNIYYMPDDTIRDKFLFR